MKKQKEESSQEKQFSKNCFGNNSLLSACNSGCATHDLVLKVKLNSKEEMDTGWRDLCGYRLVDFTVGWCVALI